MSDTEIGIIVAPETIVTESTGLRRWSPVFDALVVDKRRDNGRRIKCVVKNEIVAEFDLSEQEAMHLASLIFDIDSAEKRGPSV